MQLLMHFYNTLQDIDVRITIANGAILAKELSSERIRRKDFPGSEMPLSLRGRYLTYMTI